MDETLLREAVEHVVRAACLAPSVHNTQPWLFTWEGDVVDLHADRSRQLPVLDPYGRQLRISCGAALHHARVAARAMGLDAHVTLQPDPDAPDHLARIHLVPGLPPTEDEVLLAASLLDRHTERGLFDEQAVDDAVLDALCLSVCAEGAALRPVRGLDDRVELEVLLSRADAEEERDPEYRDELLRWTEAAIPVAALGDTSFRSSLALRAFPGALPGFGTADPPGVDRADVLVLETDGDTALDHLVAGQALGALLLRATTLGLVAQPLGQVTDKDGYRRRLGHALHLRGVAQMALRLGRVRVPSGGAPRRAVSEVLHPTGMVTT